MHGRDKEANWGDRHQAPELSEEPVPDEPTSTEGYAQKIDHPAPVRRKRKYRKLGSGRSEYLSGALTQIIVRVTKEHKMFLETEAAALGLSPGAYIRELFTDKMRGLGYPTPRRRKSLRRDIRADHHVIEDEWE
jgi:hypothetical protein